MAELDVRARRQRDFYRMADEAAEQASAKYLACNHVHSLQEDMD